MLWKLIKWLFGLPGSRDVYGSARWLTGIPKWLILNRWNCGFVIDGKNKISLKRSFTHVCLVAPTGAGKTTRVVITGILSARHNSIVALDPAGEIHKITKNYLLSRNYAVKVLNFADVSRSLKYNPIARCHTYTDLQKLASILVDTANVDGKADPFWSNAAKNILSLTLRMIKKLPPRRQTLWELYKTLNQFGHKQNEVDKLMAEHLDNTSFDEYKGILSMEDKVLNSVLATAKTALSKLSDPAIQELTSAETLHFESLRTRKTALFLSVPENDIYYFSFIVQIFYIQVLDFCMKLPEGGKEYLPILFYMDEFASMGKLNNFSNLVVVLRKRAVGLQIILQNLEQLQVYGESEAATIFSNLNSKIFMPGLSHTSTETVSKLLGQRTLSYREMGYRNNKSGFIPDRDREVSRSLLNPDEIRVLKPHQAIFIHGRELPMRIRTKPWFKNRKLRKRSKGKKMFGFILTVILVYTTLRFLIRSIFGKGSGNRNTFSKILKELFAIATRFFGWLLKQIVLFCKWTVKNMWRLLQWLWRFLIHDRNNA